MTEPHQCSNCSQYKFDESSAKTPHGGDGWCIKRSLGPKSPRTRGANWCIDYIPVAVLGVTPPSDHEPVQVTEQPNRHPSASRGD